jgi:Lysophospholipase L1 and related esterases
MKKYLLLNIIILFSFKLFAQHEQSKIDWANLYRYQEENAQLKLSANNGNRVVFMGNSITQGWKEKDSACFEEHLNYIDRGISGQTTSQMLLRFRQDVIDLKPAVVIILAGINDIAENTGHLSEEEIFANIQTMAELAKLHRIKVVLCSVLPARTIPWRKYIEPIEKIVKLNKLIKDYCTKNKIPYVDYYNAMIDENKGLKKELAKDDVHPNLAGYKVMEEVIGKTLKKVLK